MSSNEVLRSKAAQQMLERIQADRDRVSPRVRQFLEVIEESLFKKTFNIDDLRRKAGNRNRNASTLFSIELGVPPATYVGRCRLEVAARLIVDTDLSFSKIADLVGFSSGNTLGKKLKGWCGLSPSEFKASPDPELLGETPNPKLAAARSALGTALARVDDRDVDGAIDGVFDSGTVLRRQRIQDSAARLAVDCHSEGSFLTLEGDVDQGYTMLNVARQCYALVDDLPEKFQRQHLHIKTSCSTDDALASALCPSCRKTFLGDTGKTVREHLRRALALVPRDLEWFQEGSCCDDCYRIVWDAIDRARFGLMDDSFKAWWLSESAAQSSSSETVGFFVRLLAEAERCGSYKDSERRLELCKKAVGVAEALGDRELSRLALIHSGNAHRISCRFTEADSILEMASSTTSSSRWGEALLATHRGLLNLDVMKLEQANLLLREAARFFAELDLHTSSLILIRLAETERWSLKLQNALEIYEGAVPGVDHRRWPLAGDAIALNRGLLQTAVGLLGEAEISLSERPRNKAAMPSFLGALGELRLVQGNLEAARELLQESVDGLLEQSRTNEAALENLYLAEACARLGDLRLAIERTTLSLRWFSVGHQERPSVSALRQLWEYTASADQFAESLGEVVWKIGGTLPPPRYRSHPRGPTDAPALTRTDR